MIKSLFSRLMDYTPGTADLIPRSPKASTLRRTG